MSSTMEILSQILSNLRVRYDKINQLMNLTKELDAVSKNGDTVSVGMILDMRQKVMDLVDDIDRENRRLIGKLPDPLRTKIRSLLAPKGEPVRLENPMESDIFDTNKRTLLLAQRVAALDDSILQRIKGRQ